MLRGRLFVAIVAISMMLSAGIARAGGAGSNPGARAKVLALIGELQGDDTDKRENALDALLQMEPMRPLELDALAQAMKNPEEAVRRLAVQAIASSGPDAIPALARAIDDSDDEVRGRALDGLGEMAGGRGVYYSSENSGKQAELTKAAIAAAPNIWPILIRAFSDEHEDVRTRAPFNFFKDETAAVPMLRQALKSEDPKTRLGAADALRQVGPAAKDAAGDLALALKDPDRDVRVRALSALIEVDPTRKEILPIEIQRLADPKIRGGVVEQIGRMKGSAEGAVPALAHLLATQTAPDYAQDGIMFALENIGTANAALVLAQVVSGELVPTVQPVHNARPAEYYRAQFRRVAAQGIGRLGANGAAALPALEHALANDKDPNVRQSSASSIGQLGVAGAAALPVVTKALSDDDAPVVRARAAYVIVELGNANATELPALELALKDDDEEVRSAAATAIGKFGPGAADAIHPLIEAMSDSKNDKPSAAGESVADIASHSLASIGPPAVPALTAALQSSDVVVRRGAVRALERIRQLPNETIAALTRALQDKDDEVSVHAADALILVGGSAQQVGEAALDRWNKASAAEEAAEDARRYTEKEIEAPVETEIDGEKYKMEFAESWPVKSMHDTNGPATFLVTLHRGKTGPAPEQMAIWKRTGDDKFQQLYSDDPAVMVEGIRYEKPSRFTAKVLVTGQGKDRYETGLFVDVPWHGSDRNQGDEVFALEPGPLAEVEIQAADEWYAPKLRDGEYTPNGVINSLGEDGLTFEFDIGGYGAQGYHFATAGSVTGTYKIVKEMKYDAQKKDWNATWKMVPVSARREAYQESKPSEEPEPSVRRIVPVYPPAGVRGPRDGIHTWLRTSSQSSA